MTTRVDPTRTTTLRKRFSAEMSRRFNKLKRAINQLIVVEDSLGLRNDYFNPIQAIQGMATNAETKYASTQVNIPYPLVQQVIKLVRLIDPQDLHLKGVELEPHITVRYGLHAETTEEVREFIEPNAPIEAELGGVGFFPGDEYDVLFVSVASPDLIRLNRVLGKNLPHTDTIAHYKPHMTLGYLKPGMGAKWTELLSLHPLNTVTRLFWVPRTLLRLNEVIFSTKERVKVAIPLLGKQLVANTRWRFLTDEQQLEAFIAWLQVQIAAEIVTQGAESWLEKYIQKAYAGGMNRAFNDVKKPALWTGISPTESKLDFFEGTRSEFLRQSFGRPVATNRVKLLASRTFNDLRGVTDKMAAEIGRELVDGMILGLSPRDVARNMSQRVDKIGKQRALVIARTETVRAHNEGALDAMEVMGVEEVGVMVEWSTALDFKVCPECRPLQGVVLKTKEAHNMLPRHPQCRCSFIPANVGEDKSRQKRGKAKIEAAISASVRAEAPKKAQRQTIATLRRKSRWTGANKQIDKKRPRSPL